MSQSPSGSSGRTAQKLSKPNAPIAATNDRGKLTCCVLTGVDYNLVAFELGGNPPIRNLYVALLP